MKTKIISFIVIGLIVIIAVFVIYGNKSDKLAEPIRNLNVSADDLIRSPLTVQGEARGFWFFEADFPIKLVDENGNQIALGIAQAKGEWMTENFVPFKAELAFQPVTEKGFLVLEKDNPSGLPENAAEVRIPVRFEPVETMIVEVFFNNEEMDPEFSCNKVFPVERKIPKTLAVARAALEELFKGPTEEEKAESFLTSLPPDVKIQELTIENGVAKVDFNEALEFRVGGSCRVAAIRAQITETLKQFPTVQEVIIAINDRTEDILQP